MLEMSMRQHGAILDMAAAELPLYEETTILGAM